MDVESELKVIYKFVDRGNYHAAMNITISALNECRRNNDQPGVNRFIKVIKNIADTMEEVFSH